MARLATKATKPLNTKSTKVLAKNTKITKSFFLCVLCVLCGLDFVPSVAAAQPAPPALTQPVNDFAHVIDPNSAAKLDELIRSLQRASGDVVVVATIDTFQPYADIKEYAVKMFENGGRGIGQKGKDNGLLILLAVKDRQVWVEVGYDLEEFITDGYSGELSRKVMVPEFRNGNYGAGLLAGASRISSRIAQRRNVTLEGAPPPDHNSEDEVGFGGMGFLVLLAIIVLLNMIGRTRPTAAILGRLVVERLEQRRRAVRRGGGGFGGGIWRFPAAAVGSADSEAERSGGGGGGGSW
jgi:uncharacterized protein